MGVKLIAIDIDGTLLNSKRELTPVVKEALQKAVQKGVKVVLCTGRPTSGVVDFLEQLDIVSDDQYVITYNGSLIQTTDGSQSIKEYGLSFKDIQLVKEFADSVNVPYHFSDKEAMYTTNKDIGKYTVHEAKLVSMPLKYRTIEEIKKSKLSAMKAMIVDEAEKLDQVIKEIPKSFSKRFFLIKSAPYYLEVLHKDATKGNALRVLAEHLNIQMSEVMAIGDNYNDMDMLIVAGYSVAMGNAVPTLKTAAKYVTDSNDRDGVAKIVDLLVL